MPLVVPFFSGFASAKSVNHLGIFLIASTLYRRVGGKQGGLGLGGRTGPVLLRPVSRNGGRDSHPFLVRGPGGEAFRGSGAQGSVVRATGSGADWLVGPCAGERVFPARLWHLESLYFLHPLRQRRISRGGASGVVTGLFQSFRAVSVSEI